VAEVLDKSFDPAAIEQAWYRRWEAAGYFRHKDPHLPNAKPAYCIQLPPPNVTGTLHMGHAFQQTLMDALIRYHRMRGYNTNWVVGTDHAGIATQIVVERQLEMEGKTRHDLGREKFVERVWKWKQESGSTITRQMRRLGASANWQYGDAEGQKGGYFTMDARMSRAVVEVFVRLYEEGLIYRGKRLVNWDPVLGTAVSDLEVDTEEEDGRIWELLYPFADGPQGGLRGLTLATTRPETMLGDVAVAVHPEDERYSAVVGKKLRLPLAGRTIPVIADGYVDREFGTGAVKITPGHDFNDYELGKRHRLEPISILTLEARLNERAPEKYRGLDRFEARKKVLEELKAQGLLVSDKPYKLRVPRSGRTGAIVEPMLTDQWFVTMEGMARDALEVVKRGEVKFVPEHWTATYNHWLENIQDWCISRQLWWGHQIPAWYDANGKVFVGRTEEEVRKKHAISSQLRRDPDVLDTWFSSQLVPFSSLGWPQESPDLEAFLPSEVLVTGNDIIFFWVARMIMATRHFTGKVPFRDVYINAIVRDAEGEKMSKSKGNTLDPLDLIDGISFDALLKKSTAGLLREEHKERIEKYIKGHYPNGIPAFGADAVRFTFASLATFSITLNFDLNRCEGYRNFCNKLWNAARFVLMNTEGKDCGLDEKLPAKLSFIDRWIVSELQRVEAQAEQGFAQHRFDNVANAIYRFVWDEYCDWYVELAKLQLQSPDEALQRGTRRTLVRVLETALRLLHPIAPFITEELWQKVALLAGKKGDSIMLQPYPKSQPEKIDAAAERDMAVLKEWTVAARNLRSEAKIPPGEKLPLYATAPPPVADVDATLAAIQALARLSEIRLVAMLPDSTAPVAVLGEARIMLHKEVDPAVEAERISKEIARVNGEIAKATAQLANPSFVERAPAHVVEEVRKRLSNNQQELLKLQDQLQKLRGRK
jgi:valyl-tRNA synthetase